MRAGYCTIPSVSSRTRTSDCRSPICCEIRPYRRTRRDHHGVRLRRHDGDGPGDPADRRDRTTRLPGPPSGVEIAVHSSGDLLCASNRGSQTITGYRIDRPTGTLSVVGHTGQGVSGPINFVVDPGGRGFTSTTARPTTSPSSPSTPRRGELEPTGRTTSVPVPLMMALCSQDWQAHSGGLRGSGDKGV
ncbi:beta-propeller fold lactonase family protein [Streptomyces sp. NPDC001093]|uniref:beta-propeller fold lactonase family protein n=1 Tax=Streptomyces sp. NPDC001093 TaxID=3154376 RepID=UPI00331745EF